MYLIIWESGYPISVGEVMVSLQIFRSPVVEETHPSPITMLFAFQFFWWSALGPAYNSLSMKTGSFAQMCNKQLYLYFYIKVLCQGLVREWFVVRLQGLWLFWIHFWTSRAGKSCRVCTRQIDVERALSITILTKPYHLEYSHREASSNRQGRKYFCLGNTAFLNLADRNIWYSRNKL